MNAPCSVRKDKSGIFAKIKAIAFSDKITVITCVVVFAMMCFWPIPFLYFEGTYDVLNATMSVGTQIISVICAIFAYTVSIISTNYLSNCDSLEFYAKFPMGDRKTLLLKALRDICICIGTILLSLLILFLLSLVLPSEFTVSENFNAAITIAKIYAIYFLLYYSMGMLVGTLCGGLYTKILSFIMIVLFVGVLATIRVMYFDGDFETYNFYKLFPYSVVLMPGIKYYQIFEADYTLNIQLTIIMLAISAILLALSVYLVRYRKTEYAEYSFNSMVSARVFRAVGVFVTYCIIFLKMDEGRLIIKEEHPIYSEGGDVQILLDMEYTSKFNFVLPLLLFGIFLLFSYPLKNRKKLLCAYDYFPILLFLIIIENMIFGYWK